MVFLIVRIAIKAVCISEQFLKVTKVGAHAMGHEQLQSQWTVCTCLQWKANISWSCEIQSEDCTGLGNRTCKYLCALEVSFVTKYLYTHAYKCVSVWCVCGCGSFLLFVFITLPKLDCSPRARWDFVHVTVFLHALQYPLPFRQLLVDFRGGGSARFIFFCLVSYLCALLFDSYENCDQHIKDCEEHKLQTQPGCNEEETLEVCNH